MHIWAGLVARSQLLARVLMDHVVSARDNHVAAALVVDAAPCAPAFTACGGFGIPSVFDSHYTSK